ncbi:LysE family translocator [Porticoccaceae bacterium]|nr:LysE family translocator [Porticoccaceae bacterium]
MPSIEVLVAFTVAALIMNLSPGPSNLYVMARSISQGTKGGVVAAAGLAVGSLIHVGASVLGLSAIFNHSPTLFIIVKSVGAAYLIYLGISYWRAKSSVGGVKVIKQKPLLSVFKESIVVELTNPKTALFFLAVLPQFVVPESGPVSLQLLILGIIITISGLPCDMLVAVSSSKVSNWLAKHERAEQIQERVSGSILLGMGVYIAGDEIYSLNK